MICDAPPEQGDLSGEWWVQVSDPDSGELHDVRVMVDTGSPVNWILPRLVSQCNLVRVRASDVETFQDFHGNHYLCDSYVDVTWIGRTDKTRRGRFFIAPPGSPIEMLICEDFLKEHNITALFRERPTKPVLVMAQKKITVRISYRNRSDLDAKSIRLTEG
jgi:hypothetical protein